MIGYTNPSMDLINTVCSAMLQGYSRPLSRKRGAGAVRTRPASKRLNGEDPEERSSEGEHEGGAGDDEVEEEGEDHGNLAGQVVQDCFLDERAGEEEDDEERESCERAASTGIADTPAALPDSTRVVSADAAASATIDASDATTASPAPDGSKVGGDVERGKPKKWNGSRKGKLILKHKKNRCVSPPPPCPCAAAPRKKKEGRKKGRGDALTRCLPTGASLTITEPSDQAFLECGQSPRARLLEAWKATSATRCLTPS